MSALIPRITADLISALAGISQLDRKEALPQRCHLVQAIAERGTSVDELTVGELLRLANQSKAHANVQRGFPA
ncbi:hypothetical protein [Stenotrophomonas maltophilia]|uniref:hypothetical protein n=1 Tax=Stenotrophomonas maltophilia TaxID=40324 RepID=UPI0039C3456A